MKKEKTEIKNFTIHIPEMFRQMVQEAPNHANDIWHIPLMEIKGILAQIAKRTMDLQDPELIKLCFRLTLYEIGDPYSKEHDPDITREILFGKGFNYVREKMMKKKVDDAEPEIYRNRKVRWLKGARNLASIECSCGENWKRFDIAGPLSKRVSSRERRKFIEAHGDHIFRSCEIKSVVK